MFLGYSTAAAAAAAAAAVCLTLAFRRFSSTLVHTAISALHERGPTPRREGLQIFIKSVGAS